MCVNNSNNLKGPRSPDKLFLIGSSAAGLIMRSALAGYSLPRFARYVNYVSTLGTYFDPLPHNQDFIDTKSEVFKVHLSSAEAAISAADNATLQYSDIPNYPRK